MKLFIKTLLFSILFYSSFNTVASNGNELYEQGVVLYKQKQYNEALIKFEEVLSLNPLHFNTYLKKSYTLYKLEKYNSAIETIEKGFEFEPKDSRYFFMKAQFYDKLKKGRSALKYINMAIKFNDTKLMYYRFRADLNLELGNYKAAIADYDYILSITPEKYAIYYNRGLAEYNSRRKIKGCLDWAYAQEKNKNCKKMLHYKCSNIDLRPYSRDDNVQIPIVKPVFVYENDSSLQNYLRRFINYPAQSLEKVEQGLVVISFKLTKEKKIEDIKVLNSVSKTLDSLSINAVLKTSDFWESPALKKGVAIDYNYALPINFKIYDPCFEQTNLADSINNANKLGDTEKEFYLLKEYMKMNPFNYERAVRLKNLWKKYDNNITDSLTFDFSTINAEFIDEITSFGKNYRFYFDDYWKITERENAKYYIISDYYPFSESSLGSYKAYTMDTVLYSEGGFYQNKQDGKYLDYYPNGSVRCEMTFNSGWPINNLKVYYENGQVKHRIQMNKESFKFYEYYGEQGNVLLNKDGFVWEYTNIRDGAKDSLHLICQFSSSDKMAIWKLYKGTELSCEESYFKGKFKSCFVYNNGDKINIEKPILNSESLVPMAAFMFKGLKYSSLLSDETKKIINNFDIDFAVRFED